LWRISPICALQKLADKPAMELSPIAPDRSRVGEHIHDLAFPLASRG
jgi:hypothetical protein